MDVGIGESVLSNNELPSRSCRRAAFGNITPGIREYYSACEIPSEKEKKNNVTWKMVSPIKNLTSLFDHVRPKNLVIQIPFLFTKKRAKKRIGFSLFTSHSASICAISLHTNNRPNERKFFFLSTGDNTVKCYAVAREQRFLGTRQDTRKDLEIARKRP